VTPSSRKEPTANLAPQSREAAAEKAFKRVEEIFAKFPTAWRRVFGSTFSSSPMAHGQSGRLGTSNVRMVLVGDSADAADAWIAERIGAADVCVTPKVTV
jgi:hypothetical protein